MNISDIMEKREPQWKELERLTEKFRSKRKIKNADPDEIARFSSLYRVACSDLALADSYCFPQGVSKYLNNLVGLAHHQLYRNSDDYCNNFWHTFFIKTPQIIVSDYLFWTAMFLFWVPFLTCYLLVHSSNDFASKVVSEYTLNNCEVMYEKPFDSMNQGQRFQMAGFYIWNNTGIGIQCFALSILGGFGGLWILLINAIGLGTIFGHMTSSSVPFETTRHFTEFVTAHGPFELMAIVMSAACGMRMGFAFISSRGFNRFDSVRLASKQALPILTLTIVLFCLAAMIEAFISPNPLTICQYFGCSALLFKQGIAILSGLLLFFYIVILGLISLFQYKSSETS